MKFNFYEQLLFEFFDYRGYFVKTNLFINKLIKGGYESEVDILAINLTEYKLVVAEVSNDADSWDKRIDKFGKKLSSAIKYFTSQLFQELPREKKWNFKFWICLPSYKKNFPSEYKEKIIRKAMANLGYQYQGTQLYEICPTEKSLAFFMEKKLNTDITFSVQILSGKDLKDKIDNLIEDKLNKNLNEKAIPETYPLLRMIQWLSYISE